MEKVVFLGCNRGTSKKSGKDFAFIHLINGASALLGIEV